MNTHIRSTVTPRHTAAGSTMICAARYHLRISDLRNVAQLNVHENA